LAVTQTWPWPAVVQVTVVVFPLVVKVPPVTDQVKPEGAGPEEAAVTV
jgi:hypothetical protein